MTNLAIVMSAIGITLFSILWFYIVLWISKHTVGKDAHITFIIIALVIAGPLGWATILIMIGCDITDKISRIVKSLR